MLEVAGELLTCVHGFGQIWVPQKGIVWPCGRFELSRLTQFVHCLLPQFPHLWPILCNKISRELKLDRVCWAL